MPQGAQVASEARLAAQAILLLTCGLLTVAAAPGIVVSGPQQPDPDRIVAVGAVTYSTAVSDVECKLSYLPADQSLLLAVQTSAPTVEQFADCLKPLLDAVLADHQRPEKFSLTLDKRDFVLERLDAVLDRSPDWNVKTGQPRSGMTGPVIRTVFNREGLAHEIADVFAHDGYSLSLSSVAMISVGRVPAFKNHLLPTGVAQLEFKAMKVQEVR